MHWSAYPRIAFDSLDARRSAPCRANPYWNLIRVGRHIGFEKKQPDPSFWVAQVKLKDGRWRQHRLGMTDDHCSADGV